MLFFSFFLFRLSPSHSIQPKSLVLTLRCHGENIYLSSTLSTKDIEMIGVIPFLKLHLKGFHCWATTNPDICSKPHFSIIEDACAVPLISESGFEWFTKNGAANAFVNFSVPVFMLPGTDKTWLTCDFEVCEGTCEEVSKNIIFSTTICQFIGGRSRLGENVILPIK